MIPGIIEASRWVSPFSDTFNRANTGNINTSNIEWTEIVGDWQILDNTAYSATTAASYPLVVLDIEKQNVQITAYNGSAGSGFGVAFWVKDSDNWWAVVTDTSTSSATGTVYSCPSGGTLSGTTCLNTCYQTCYETCYNTCCGGGVCANNGNLSAQGCGLGGYEYGCYDSGGCGCYGYEVGDPGSCTCYSGPVPGYSGYPRECYFDGYYYFNGTCYSSARNGTVPGYYYPGTMTSTYACNPYNCNPYSCNPYSCNYAATATTTTITTYTHTIKLIKKEAGVLSTVATQTHSTEQNAANYISSVTVSTNNNVITYSAVRSGVTASYTATASSPVFAERHGMIFAPATTAQGNKIDRFDYVA